MKRIALARKLRAQIHEFLGIFYPHFSKPKLKFIEEMVYGIQASQGVLLSDITRALGEEIQVKKTEERLSRHLETAGLGQKVNEIVAEHAARRVGNDTLIIIDPSDIQKPYAEKMPYLAHVRDGNTGELVHGYWMCCAVACEPSTRRIVPLHQRLWSADSPDFVSENTQLQQVIDTIRTATKGRGIYVIDRGGDRDKLINPLLDRKLRFIIRLVGTRNLVFRGKEMLARTIGEGCPMMYADTVVKDEKGEEKTYRLEYGYRPVKLPGRDEQLYLVVVRGYGHEPMLLLTPIAMRRNRNVVWRIVRGYCTRWLIEETIRFIKQSYGIEDIRVLRYERLRNLVALVMAAVYFSAVWLGESLKLKVLAMHVAKAAKRFFGVPDFHYYALADGISVLLMYLGSCMNKVKATLSCVGQVQTMLFAPI
jgi:hypothetical protein